MADIYRNEGAADPTGARKQDSMESGQPSAAGGVRPIDIRRWQGVWVFDEDGDTVGRVSDVLVDDKGSPEWIVVSTGPFLHIDKLVPIFDMEDRADGFVLPYSRDMVKKGPTVDMDDMSDEEEQELYSYWCVSKTAAMPRTCRRLSSGRTT
jgi:sporulation protein YlmC with PRC-barrel domain